MVAANYQKIIKKGNKQLWGVRLFEKATTASTRRSFRSTRRRLNRRRERILLLQKEFAEEINKVDPNFFIKLKESSYLNDDKDNKTIFYDTFEKQKIKEYNKKYPTIYHVRQELVNNSEKADIRLIYLAFHHMIKYRGNFLYNFKDFNVDELDIKKKFLELFEFISEKNVNIIINDLDSLNLFKIEKDALLDSKTDKKVTLNADLKNYLSSNFLSEFIKMINGSKFDIVKMFDEKAENKLLISFKDNDYDDKYAEIEGLLGENIEIVEILKQLYDLIFLKHLFKNTKNTNISSLMVEKYNKHKKDLSFLKKLFSCDKNKYREFLRSDVNKSYTCVYDEYIHNAISYEEFISKFYKVSTHLLEKCDDEKLIELFQKEIQLDIEKGEFLPRITDKENGKYPYQLNLNEMNKIIENQGKYYSFLKNQTKDGEYKIIKILKFRIPYYVGPLVSNEKSNFAWMIRKSNEKITPYNFDDVVDKEASAEKFILRMIGHCTYLLKEYAIPNQSILYSKFKVYNELKQIKVNNERLTVELQQKIFNELFCNKNRTSIMITNKEFENYLMSTNEFSMYGQNLDITGYSAFNKFANNMQSYIDFFGVNGFFRDTNLKEEDAENIIKWITIFEDKNILKKRIKNIYSNLSDAIISEICKKNYSGWSGLSQKLLVTPYYNNKETNTKNSILDLLINTKENFMQIINNDEYEFQKFIQQENEINNIDKLNYDIVDSLATSPTTKRGIWQALNVVREIVDYMGYEPYQISIEMARGDEEKVRTVDKKKKLIDLYDKNKKEIQNYSGLYKKLSSLEKLNTKQYLYFIQEGKCLYTGQTLDFENLEDCEIDHIIPQSIIADNSLDNKALVLRKYNQNKKNDLVLPREWIKNNIKWWNLLLKRGFISPKKFYRLTREKYSQDDIKGFINRQLVETRQITKHVANILNNYHKKTKIIYLPASLSHNYREKFQLYKFRDINDYHHAHDAYLAAVLGEYKNNYFNKAINFNELKEFNKKLTKNKNYEKLKYGFVINSIEPEIKLENDKTGELFNYDAFTSNIEKTLYRNDILISKKTEIRTGEFYNQTIYKKAENLIPKKANLDPAKYGGYKSSNPSYGTYIKYQKGKKVSSKIIGIPIYIDTLSKKDETIKDAYIRKLLKLSMDDKYIIDAHKIPFYSTINWEGQICSLVSAPDKVEVCNAKELNISKNDNIKYKFMLNRLLNNKKESISDEEYNLKLEEFINYIKNKIKKEYKLFENLITELELMLPTEKLKNFTIEEKEKTCKEILKLLKCNSLTSNFKFLSEKYSSTFGRKKSKTISNCIVLNKSVTGIYSNSYVLNEDNSEL